MLFRSVFLRQTHRPAYVAEFDPNQSAADSRRAQFRLVDGALLTHEAMGREAYPGTPKQQQKFAKHIPDYRSKVGELPDGADFGPFVILVEARDTVGVDVTINTPNMYPLDTTVSSRHATGWLEFAKQAFATAPTSLNYDSLYFTRETELKANV